MSVKVRTVLYGTLFLGLLVVYLPYFQVLRLDEYISSLTTPWLEYGGIGLFVLGAVLVFASAYYLVRRGEGTPAPFDAPKKFVLAGPYQYVRNPMMMGLFAMIFGEAMWFSSPSIFLYGLLIVVLVCIFVAYIEESGLERRFGEEYLAYKKAVSPWFPRWGRKGK
jgi:protein-S-isoprenylcysteine O-methyltransferase Ste14